MAAITCHRGQGVSMECQDSSVALECRMNDGSDRRVHVSLLCHAAAVCVRAPRRCYLANESSDVINSQLPHGGAADMRALAATGVHIDELRSAGLIKVGIARRH